MVGHASLLPSFGPTHTAITAAAAAQCMGRQKTNKKPWQTYGVPIYLYMVGHYITKLKQSRLGLKHVYGYHDKDKC